MPGLMPALITLPFRLVPSGVRLGLAKALFYAAGARSGRDALRELLQIDAALSGQIDLAALSYGSGVHVKHRLTRYHDFFVERIAPGDRVLDVGCGYGAVARSIAERTGADVTGIDLDAGNIAQARHITQPRLRFIHGRAPEDVPGERIDVIVLSNVLEHIEHRVEFLRALAVRTGATRMLLRVPMSDRDWRVPLRRELGLFHFSDPTHFTEYTRESFEDEMQAAELDIRHLRVNWGEIWAEATTRA